MWKTIRTTWMLNKKKKQSRGSSWIWTGKKKEKKMQRFNFIVFLEIEELKQHFLKCNQSLLKVIDLVPFQCLSTRWRLSHRLAANGANSARTFNSAESSRRCWRSQRCLPRGEPAGRCSAPVMTASLELVLPAMDRRTKAVRPQNRQWGTHKKHAHPVRSTELWLHTLIAETLRHYILTWKIVYIDARGGKRQSAQVTYYCVFLK